MASTLERPAVNPPVFLDSEPPPWAARGLASLLLVLAGAAAVGAVVIRLPESVSSPFALVPSGGTDPVRAPCDGLVAQVRAADGRTVSANEPLFVIRSDVSADRSGELAGLEIQLTGARESLAHARRRFEALARADDEEKRRLEARGANLTAKIATTREIHIAQEKTEVAAIGIGKEQVANLERELEYRRKVHTTAAAVALTASKLLESHAVSDLENLRIRLDADKAKLELQQAERELNAARLKLEQLQTQHDSQHKERAVAAEQLATDARENDASLARLRRQREAADQEQAEAERSLRESADRAEIRIAALRKELDRSRGHEVTVQAPCAGSVLRLRVRAAGAYVRAGDPLCELAREGDRLEAELAVPQSGAGRVSVGQRVKLMYEAFPYQRYGLRYGTVRWVSPGSTTGEEGPVFRILVSPDEDAIRADGQERRLLAGMRGRADVLVGRRRLIAYLFEPLRQLRENLATEPVE